MENPGRSTTAVVLAGAGARGAYEAGTLSQLLPALAANGRRPRMFIGTSAGAINAVLFASLAHLPADVAAREALRLWREVSRRDVVHSIVVSGLNALFRYLAQLAGWPVALTSMLDASPLQSTLTRLVDWDQLHANAARPGVLQAVSVTTTDCATGRTKVFVECHRRRPLPPADDRRGIDYIPARLDSSHLMASAAIPLLFPPTYIATPDADRGWYLDGGVRLNAPIKPAVALGATRLVLLATDAIDRVSPCAVRLGPQPDVRAALSDVLRALLVDRMVEDIRRLGQMNELLQRHTPGGGVIRSASGRRRRVIPFVFAGPAQSDALSELAAHEFQKRYGHWRWLRHSPDYPLLHRLLGAAGTVNGDLLSYLFFERCFLEAAIELGQQDAQRLIDQTEHRLLWQTRIAPPTLQVCEFPPVGAVTH
ncbi:MAG TPA: patatin-like phospholipase family protein [Moraxellaceae bacterium]|nr:patatin-like phospholipase family protein [Moraxellaceae bacterium]